jgi:hypothetical protein
MPYHVFSSERITTYEVPSWNYDKKFFNSLHALYWLPIKHIKDNESIY